MPPLNTQGSGTKKTVAIGIIVIAILLIAGIFFALTKQTPATITEDAALPQNSETTSIQEENSASIEASIQDLDITILDQE